MGVWGIMRWGRGCNEVGKRLRTAHALHECNNRGLPSRDSAWLKKFTRDEKRPMKPKTIRGPGLFISQFIGAEPPFDSLGDLLRTVMG